MASTASRVPAHELEDVCGQGQFTLWGMEPAEARATETEGWQAEGESHFRAVSPQDGF